MRKLLLFLSVFLIKTTFSQNPFYKTMMYDSQYNFYQVCDSAEAYFKTVEKEKKGSGYKPYLRWKHENESKYFPTGDRKVDNYMPWNEYQRIKNEQASYNSNNRLFATGGWKSLGPDTIGVITEHYATGLGRVEYVEVNKNNDQEIYMGSRSGGLWRTSNGGTNWVHHTDFLPASGVDAITASPTHFDSVLINVRNADNGTSFGIYRSTDGGVTFAQTPFNPVNVGFGGLGSNFKIYVIKYHPRIPNLIFVGTNEGIYRSTDNLQTWTRLIPTRDIYEIEFHPINNNIIYLYDNNSSNGTKNNVLKSTDQGLTYTTLSALPGNSNARLNIVTTPTCPTCVYATSDNGIWLSTNEGATFSTKVSPAPLGVSLWYATPNDIDTSKFVSGYVDLFRSTNGGLNFNKCTWWSLGNTTEHGGTDNQSCYNNSNVYVHADCNYQTCVNGVFYVCTDGFLCKSTDNGQTWVKLSLSTGIRENYNLGVSQSNHYVTICGSQDNGTSIKTENGWIEAYGADGMEGIIHPLNDKWMIGSTQYGGRRRTLDGGYTTSGVSQPQSGSGNAYWKAPLVYDPNNHMTLYSFAKNVFKSDDFGSTWTTLGTASTFANLQIEYASIAENNSSIMVITREEKINISVDGGLTFTDIKNTLPNNWITDVVFDPNDDSTIIVTYDTYQNNGQKIYITHNLGQTWQNITYNLGNMPITSVLIDHTDSSNIYIGATIGIYTKSMNASAWQLYNPDLPNVTVKEMEINYGSNTIKAATWGRGLWEYVIKDRNSYPAIVKTSITNPPTFDLPKTSVLQYVTSDINYTGGTLSSVFVRWAINTPTFTVANTIPMSLVSGATWKSNVSLPDFPAGTKVFFKVYAVGENADTTETYKFMYELKPFAYCVASATTDGNNLHINRFRLANIDKTSTNTTYTLYPSPIIILYTDSVYDAVGNFNYSFSGANDFNVWIDYNKDADFTTNELVVNKPNFTTSGTYTAGGSFLVPANASSDTLRLRARYAYWGTGDSPCGTTLGEVEDYKVVIRTAPSLSITGNSSYCFGTPLNINYTGSVVDSLKWILNNGSNTYTFNGTAINTSILNSGTYSVSLKGYNYAMPFTKNYNNYFVINPLPIVSVSNGTICAGNSYTISPTGAVNYTYSSGSNIVNPSSTEVYTVTGVDANNCVGTKTVSVNVNALPIITVSTSNTLLCVGQSATLTALGATSYLWNNSTNSFAMAISPTVTTTYTVNGTDANGCANTTSITQNVSTCTNIHSAFSILNPAINVYPNPTNGLFIIELNENIIGGTIQVSNVLGEILISQIINKSIYEFDLTNKASGIYFMTIKANNKQYTHKIIKQ